MTVKQKLTADDLNRMMAAMLKRGELTVGDPWAAAGHGRPRLRRATSPRPSWSPGSASAGACAWCLRVAAGLFGPPCPGINLVQVIGG
jgi:hypothetical protein